MHDPEHRDLPSVLLACGRGEVPSNVAVMQAIVFARDKAELEQALQETAAEFLASGDRTAAGRVRSAARLWKEVAAAWPVLRSILAVVAEGDPDTGPVERWSTAFDRAVAISPEASVALYSLGRSDLLAQATAEVVAVMAGWGLLGPGRLAIEIGCGIGRFLGPIAATGTRVLGLDISAGMLAEAGRRCVPGVMLVRSGGADLVCLADGVADLVYAIDSFPYLVEAGVAAAHVSEARRVLKPGGTFLLMNWSYRGDVEADRAEVAELAQACGLRLAGSGRRTLRHWDAEVFRMERPAWSSPRRD